MHIDGVPDGADGPRSARHHHERPRENKTNAARRCRQTLAKQLGLITRDQALACGLSRRQIDRLLANEEWLRLYRGIYASASAQASWRRSVLAAVFRAGPGSVASGSCAAALMALAGFRPGIIEVSTPRTLKGIPFKARRVRIPADQTVRIGGVPTTDGTRALLDIAGEVDDQKLQDALDDALRRSLTSLPRLRWLLATSGKGKKGSRVLARLVEQRADGQPIPESVLETRLWKPLTRLGVPHPLRQHEVQCGSSRYRIDFAFPHAMVAVEGHSYRWHSSMQALQNDAEKHNALVVLGWNVVYLTWKDVTERREATMDFLRDLLLARFL